jgi:Helicase conserved C-terminal domain
MKLARTLYIDRFAYSYHTHPYLCRQQAVNLCAIHAICVLLHPQIIDLQCCCTFNMSAGRRADCEKLESEINAHLCAGALEARDWSVAYYHAGLGQSDRERVQRQWVEGDIVAVVATIAFGMGIDKSDIRWVMHYMLPSSLEGFAQAWLPLA